VAKLLDVGLLPASALEEAYANLRQQVRSTRTVTLLALSVRYGTHYGTGIFFSLT
jgi:hypothetical protein